MGSFLKLKRGYRLIGLRGKLLLATLALLILPVTGLSYLKELELFLKNNHSKSVLVIAKTIASVFQDNASLSTLNQLTLSPFQAVYCHSLKNKKIIDGYSDDWFSLQNRQQLFYPPVNDSMNLSLLCVNDEEYYYFLVTINTPSKQNNQSFGQVAFNHQPKSHYINFQYLDYAHNVQDYYFKLNSPGWINGQLVNSLAPVHRQIPAQWQENDQSVTLEFKLPINRINHYIGFELKQEKQQNQMQTLVTTMPATHLQSLSVPLNPVILTDPLSTLKLEHLAPPDTRIWLLNKSNYISAKTNLTFQSDNDYRNDFSLLGLYRRLYLIFSDYPEQQSFYGSNQIQINNHDIQLTMKGKSTVHWLDTSHSDKMVLSVTTPVYDNENKVIGTLVLEQKNETLLALQDQTFERILLLTIILFFTVALILFFLSTRLLKRIINLRNDTNRALSNDGIISNQLYRNDNDEVGDLARSFHTLLLRIEQNNQYLRSLSGKLSHELRTPLTIIKSSLENMVPDTLSEDNKKYTQRAYEGCSRLSNLLNRMSEASRLEQSINSIEKENIDMVNFLMNYIDSLRVAHTTTEILFETSLKKLDTHFSPELIAQLLDKLFSNAVSFHKTGTPIRLKLSKEKNTLCLEINNYGDFIDTNKMDSIFSSLTSYRAQKTIKVHLGLGLYISKLICEFHNGQLSAVNNEKNQSVSFILKIPI